MCFLLLFAGILLPVLPVVAEELKVGLDSQFIPLTSNKPYIYLITHDIQPRIQKLDYNRTYIESVS